MVPIATVAKTTGIPAFSLRNWEKRFGFPKACRNEKGIRYYDNHQITALLQVKEALDAGMRVSAAIAMVEEGQSPVETSTLITGSDRTRILRALTRYDEQRALSHLEPLEKTFSPYQMLEFLYAPMLHQTGRLWEEGQISVAQEHFTTAFLRMRLQHLIVTQARRAPGSTEATLALAATPGELHEGSLLLLAAYLSLRGTPIHYLGLNTSIGTLIEYKKSRPDSVVCLSYTMGSQWRSDRDELHRIDGTIACGGQGVETDLEGTLPENVVIVTGAIKACVESLEKLAKHGSVAVGRQ